jgi:hypothetical protein
LPGRTGLGWEKHETWKGPRYKARLAGDDRSWKEGRWLAAYNHRRGRREIVLRDGKSRGRLKWIRTEDNFLVDAISGKIVVSGRMVGADRPARVLSNVLHIYRSP